MTYFEINLDAVLTSIEIRDSNPGPVFSIPGFGIGEIVIPGSRRDYGIPALISKTVIFEYNGIILLNLHFLSQRQSASQAYSFKLML